VQILNNIWVGAILTGAGLFALVPPWYAAVRAHHGIPLRLIYQTMRFRLDAIESPNRILNLLAPALAIIFFVFSREYVYIHSSIWLGVFVVSLSIASSELVPGCVLFLGRSSPDSAQLNLQIIKSLYPYKVVSLLEPRGQGIIAKTISEECSLRLETDEKWRVAVELLSDRTPVIVVDTRVVTPFVVEECQTVLVASRVSKTVFVVNAASDSPVLDIACPTWREMQLFAASPSKLVPAIRRLMKSKRATVKSTQ
jgi:hypothetical protein